jgi:hypothetical protein
MLRAGENVLLDETASLEQGERYLAYTGGRWMLRSEVYYSTSEFLTPSNLVTFYVDGVAAPGQFGQLADLNGDVAFRPNPPVPLLIEPNLDHVELHTRPVFMPVSGYLPGETSAESVEIETAPNAPFASTTKNVFTLFDSQTQADYESVRTLEWLMAPAAEESEPE